MDDWYNVYSEQIMESGGRGLLLEHLSSTYRALQAVYPEHHWQAWKFIRQPKRQYLEHSEQRKYFDWLIEKLELKKMEDWYEISTEEVIRQGGYSFLQAYDRSMYQALKSIYPEHYWPVHKFTQPAKFWSHIENQRLFFNDWLTTEENSK